MIETILSHAGNVAAQAILRAALPSMPLAYLVRTLRALKNARTYGYDVTTMQYVVRLNGKPWEAVK